MKKPTYKNRTFLILGTSILAAAWLIKGPDILQGLAMPTKAVDLLVYMPAMVLVFIMAGLNRNFMRCEYRAWRRIFGK